MRRILTGAGEFALGLFIGVLAGLQYIGLVEMYRHLWALFFG